MEGTEAIRKLFDECRGGAADPGLAAAENEFDALLTRLQQAEAREAVLREALENIKKHQELVQGGVPNGMSTTHKIATDALDSLTSAPSNLVAVTVEELREIERISKDGPDSRCPVCDGAKSPSPSGSRTGHFPDCWLAKNLGGRDG